MKWQFNKHIKILISRVWAPALLRLAFAAAITIGNGAIQKLSQMAPGDAGALIPYAFDIGAWLSAAFLINRVVDLVIWELLVARGTTIKVPKLLRQLGALIIYGGGLLGTVFLGIAMSLTAKED